MHMNRIPDEAAHKTLKSLVKRILPSLVGATLRRVAKQPARMKRASERAWIRYRIDSAGRRDKSVRLLGYKVRINKGTTPYHLYDDIFVNHVYHFEAQRANPLILDCGSNIGMSVLYFKHLYPRAHVVAFEPDPTIFEYLRENVAQNGLTDVQLVQGALAEKVGTVMLNSDGEVASHIEAYRPEGSTREWTRYEVPCVRLRDYLAEPVDFMKMNIEGAEWEVLADCEPLLSQVREMNIEYHRLPGVPCTLHLILDLLHRNHFQYVVSDFGLEMYGSARPPASVDSQARFWRQIYARRMA